MYYKKNVPEYSELSILKSTIGRKLEMMNTENFKAYNQLARIENNHSFYSKNTKEAFDNLYSDWRVHQNQVAKAKGIVSLDKKLKLEGRELSTSPYSFSMYGIKKGQKVDWR